MLPVARTGGTADRRPASQPSSTPTATTAARPPRAGKSLEDVATPLSVVAEPVAA